MNTSNVAKVKYIIRQVSQQEVEQLVATLLHHDDAEQILTDMISFFEEKELSGFIRAGR